MGARTRSFESGRLTGRQSEAFVNKHSVLVVDDDQSTREYLNHFLSSRGYRVSCLDTGDGIMARLSGSPPSVMILDLRMPGLSGMEALAQIRALERPVPVIVISALGGISTVVKAIKMGASDYLVKPFEEEELELAIENVLEKSKLSDEVKTLRRQLRESGVTTDIVSSNPKVMRMREVAAQVAATDVPVLILGESGVGKEVFARFIHARSGRADKPMVKVNCAALPHDLLESELFGFDRGAFTGATHEKPGKFELANNGSILLDEIGEMSTQLQAKLLHVLQDGEFTRLGASRPTRVDARILAATNRRLEEAVARGEFREDLYFRLNVIRIEVPPLRERKEDIPVLCTQLFKQYSAKYGREGAEIPRQLMEVFLRYDWPGNIRQLESAIKRFLIMPDLEGALPELKDVQEAQTGPRQKVSLKKVSAKAAEEAERRVVLQALEEANWNCKQVARELDVCYKTLLNKLHKWEVPLRSPAAAYPVPPIAKSAGSS
jgi:two-component system, NtrC family, response regulator AtoC